METLQQQRPDRRRRLPVVPQRQQVSLDQVQDSFDPQPEGERFLIGALLQRRQTHEPDPPDDDPDRDPDDDP